MQTDRSLASPGLVAWRTRHLVALMLVSGLMLIALTLVASQADPNAIDIGATRWIQTIKSTAFATLMYWVSWFGFPPEAWLMPPLVAAPFAVRRLWAEALWVLGSQLASVLTIVVKQVINRPRPSPELVGVITRLSDPGFPSGHVVQYTALFGVAFSLVYQLAQPSMMRTAVLILLAVPIVLVGPSRLYLAQHWLSDVLGGRPTK